MKLKLQYFGLHLRSADHLETMWGKMRGKREGDGRGRDSCITDSLDMNMSGLWEIVKDGSIWRSAVKEVAKSWTQLSDWTITSSLQNALNEAAKTINFINPDPCAHLSFLPRALCINHFRVHPGMSIVSRKRLLFISSCHRFRSELN